MSTGLIYPARRSAPAAALHYRRFDPPPSFSSPDVDVAAALEPSYAVAGDAYEYAYNEKTLHVAVVDAIGHDLHASVVSGLAVGAYRHARRRCCCRGLFYTDGMTEARSANGEGFGLERFEAFIRRQISTACPTPKSSGGSCTQSSTTTGGASAMTPPWS